MATKIMATILVAQFVIIIVAVLAVVGLKSVDDGADQFDGLPKAAAMDALRRAYRACSDEPGQRITNRKWRVVELEILQTETASEASTQSVIPKYRAALQAYTLFGIPTLKIEVGPGDGVSCIEGL